MDVVKLSEFVSEFSCRYGENQTPIVSHKFLSKEHLIDDIENDTELFDLYGTIYIYRAYLMLFKGEVAQKMLEHCLDFMTVNPLANPQHMFKATLRPQIPEKIIKNNYRRDESIKNVTINRAISFVNRLIESRVIVDHFDDYPVMIEKIHKVGEEFFPGYYIQMSLVDDIINASLYRTNILNGKNVQNYHTYSLSKSVFKRYEQKDVDEIPRDVVKELLFHNLIVTKDTRECFDILNTNILMAFNIEHIENYRDSLTKKLIFVNMDTDVTCFTSWNDMRNWVQSNSEMIYTLIRVLSDVSNGYSVKSDLEGSIYDLFAVFKRPLFDHVEALSVGSSFDEVDRNKNRQKLFSGMQNILERLVANK